jgi:hypothetical protein
MDSCSSFLRLAPDSLTGAKFDLSNSGDEPVGELIRDPQGHLFGVAFKGGLHLGGTVFEITP